ncbi:hypothetical protein [Ralstonia phage RP31]|uniref:Radical SAM core domain-containing protein n=2 Tax=Ripduovirus RP12 TaxID=2560700 RepID=A0A1L7N0Q5_9CAUD|nr:radical SAM domain-containing protein [Ralstonia phage RP12]BAW19050.1 hypothetical protein [Ralstonia phage RP12]BAW19335.1 hypothetical protein [Ralstonia phage RP31]
MQEQVIKIHRKKEPIDFKKPGERIKTIAEVKDILFAELKVLNVILTNACNLSCSYCFEQHKQDYGKFTQEQLKQVYDFLLNANTQPHRHFQFFGGEPLAQKKKILDFCRDHKDELSANKEQVRVSIVTNALLLTPEFIEEYCSYDFTSLVISLDTDDAESNRRELTQENIDYIFEMIKLLPDSMMRDAHHVSIRCTINEESVPHLDRFMERLYASGVRNFVIHPLILAKDQGAIEWQPGMWERMYHSLHQAMHRWDDFKITWAEGVGVKGESNCMVGSDMIAMDASGDFSGCYFLTNLKETYGNTMLGNLFRDEIYIDRYVEFQQAYAKSLEHEQCQSCHLKNFCYQCPAGNAATGGSLFRPDSMCKRIVELFLTLRQDFNRKALLQQFKELEEAVVQQGPIAQSRAVLHCIYREFTGEIQDNAIIDAYEELPAPHTLLFMFKQMLEGGLTSIPPLDVWVSGLLRRNPRPEESIDPYEFYLFLCKLRGIPIDFKYTPNGSVQEQNYFITLTHLLIFDESRYLSKYDPEHSRSRILDL